MKTININGKNLYIYSGYAVDGYFEWQYYRTCSGVCLMETVVYLAQGLACLGPKACKQIVPVLDRGDISEITEENAEGIYKYLIYMRHYETDCLAKQVQEKFGLEEYKV